MKSKIFVDGRTFDTEYQGTRTYIQNLYNQIDKIGDLDILIGTENPEKTALFFPNSENITFVKYRSSSKLNRIINEIPSIVDKYKVDISHFQYVIAPFMKTKQMVTIHDILFKDFPSEFSFKYRFVKGISFFLSAKNADVLTTVSEYSKTTLHKHFNIPLSNIHVVPNGVADSFFEEYNKSSAIDHVSNKYGISNYILYVSRIEPRKNQLLLLKSFLELKLYAQGKFLLFVGKKSIDVPEMNDILSSLDENIRNKIVFLENISDDDLRFIYKAADLFIFPSKAEGFGIPPLEAGALKIPTICSNTTAMADFTFFGRNHIDITSESLNEAIIHSLKITDMENLTKISQCIKTDYGWKESADKLNRIILSSIGS